MKEWNTPNQVPEWDRLGEGVCLQACSCPCVCVSQVRVCERMDEWVNKCSRTEGEREKEREGERICSVREDTLHWLWLKYGPINTKSIELQLHSSLHSSAPPHCHITLHDTHTLTLTLTDTLIYMHTVGTTLCWHFILSFTIVQLWTQGNYRGYIQQFSRAHCGLKCGRMKQEKIESSSSGGVFLILGTYSDSQRRCNFF